MNGEGPNKNLRKINHLNGEGEGMLEKINKTPHMHPQPSWNTVKYNGRVVGGHPSNMKRKTGRQAAWESKTCLADTSR